MDNNKKKDKIAKIIGIIVGIILVLGISYALFSTVLRGKKKVRITTGTLDLQLVETDENDPLKYTHIELDNALPMTNADGLKTTPYMFTLKNLGNIDANYVLSLEVENSSDLPAGSVKYAIERVKDDSGNFESSPLLLSQVNAHASKNLNNDDVMLYDLDEGKIKVSENIDYKLYIWVDYDAGIEAANKTLTAVVRISGTQIIK